LLLKIDALMLTFLRRAWALPRCVFCVYMSTFFLFSFSGNIRKKCELNDAEGNLKNMVLPIRGTLV
jgi:hypothetical protein